MKKMRIVIALGGNALGKNLPEQYIAVKETAKAIVDLIEYGHEVIITHGNGPQVGMIDSAMSLFAKEDSVQGKTPLSMCVAMSQAYIGYDMQNALRREMRERSIARPVSTVLTQVRVDKDDPAFLEPSKPIGKFMTKEEADFASKKYGHIFIEDSGRGYRRVVPSPRPQEIIELSVIRLQVEDGNIVVCCGGGGIPVVAIGEHLKGVSAVIDKDYASSLLARELDADMFVILTAVEKVSLNYKKENERQLDTMSVSEAERYLREGHFQRGSMYEKVDACAQFAMSKKGRVALVTELSKAKDGLLGLTGTRIEG
ncbi:MAG: carbamate kinase [Ruminococcus sp.]|nr:carbamate kinase [Ruminococcus sp.]